METGKVKYGMGLLALIAIVAFSCGVFWSMRAQAAEPRREAKQPAQVRYPDRTELDFEGLQIEGEIRNPGEFYFQHRQEEKFDSLVKRRKNFHRELLRDAVLSR